MLIVPHAARATLNTNENALYVLGQPNFTSNSTNCTQSGMNFSDNGVAYDTVDNLLWVSDPNNNRVLAFNASSFSNGMNASYVLGQSSFTTCNAGTTTQSGMSFPLGLAYDSVHQRLFVADNGNNRVLVFSTSSISNNMNASYVLGQANFTTNGNATTQSGMYNPRGLAYDAVNNRLFVGDQGNCRVTVYSTSSITNGENAANELGEPNFTSSNCNETQPGIWKAAGVALDSTYNRLFVADNGYNRVTVYSTSSISNGENASYVLGQVNFTSDGTATSQSGMSGPWGVAYDSNSMRLFVADGSNNRVLVFNAGPSQISNGMNASKVIGQANFTSHGSATSQSGLDLGGLGDVAYNLGTSNLFVVDYGNARVLVFDGTFFPAADYFNP